MCQPSISTGSDKADKTHAEERIWITHFINPHQFYFKYERSFFNNELCKLENAVQTFAYSDEQRGKSYKPQRGEIVAVLHIAWNKWIRAFVDVVDSKCILWAIDHGVPIQSTAEWIVRLPDELAKHVDVIHLGGIADCVPAAKNYNWTVKRVELQAAPIWSASAIQQIDELLANAFSIKFAQKYTKNGQTFGDVEIMGHCGTKARLKEVLKEIEQGMSSADFLADLDKLKTMGRIRWLNNEDSLAVFNTNLNRIETDEPQSVQEESSSSKVMVDRYAAIRSKISSEDIKATENISVPGEKTSSASSRTSRLALAQRAIQKKKKNDAEAQQTPIIGDMWDAFATNTSRPSEHQNAIPEGYLEQPQRAQPIKRMALLRSGNQENK